MAMMDGTELRNHGNRGNLQQKMVLFFHRANTMTYTWLNFTLEAKKPFNSVRRLLLWKTNRDDMQDFHSIQLKLIVTRGCTSQKTPL